MSRSNRSNHIADLGPRDIGRKNKPTPRRENDLCDYKIGARIKLIYVKRKNPQPGERKVAQIPVIDGGTRCKSRALVRKPTGERRCAEHIGATYKQQNTD